FCNGNGNGNGTIELTWLAKQQLLVRKTDIGFFDGNYLCDCSLRNFTTVTEPVLPSDLATKSYLEGRIAEVMNAKFQGTLVTLNETDFVEVAALKSGAYFVTVSPQGFPGP